jgi:hypothetical protein
MNMLLLQVLFQRSVVTTTLPHCNFSINGRTKKLPFLVDESVFMTRIA